MSLVASGVLPQAWSLEDLKLHRKIGERARGRPYERVERCSFAAAQFDLGCGMLLAAKFQPRAQLSLRSAEGDVAIADLGRDIARRCCALGPTGGVVRH